MFKRVRSHSDLDGSSSGSAVGGVLRGGCGVSITLACDGTSVQGQQVQQLEEGQDDHERLKGFLQKQAILPSWSDLRI